MPGLFESVRAELLAQGSNVTISMVHLPAVNTPQFEWCLSRLPKHPQPVPPIYQPEVRAEFILEAALDCAGVATDAVSVGWWRRPPPSNTTSATSADWWYHPLESRDGVATCVR